MSDILDRVFGPDPGGRLPTLATGYGAARPHVHYWMEHEAAGIQYWECISDSLVCRATTVDPPPRSTDA